MVTKPSIAITAAEVSSGGSSNDATLSLTFASSEATSDLVQGDVQLTNASLSNFTAQSSTVYTATLAPTAAGLVSISLSAGAFTSSSTGEGNVSGQFSWTYSLNKPSPLNKVDVIGLLDATHRAVSRWGFANQSALNDRMAWLRRNQDRGKRSIQGIKIAFKAPYIDQLLNQQWDEAKSGQLLDADNFMLSLEGKEIAQVASAARDRSLDLLIHVAMQKKQEQLGQVSLNPTSGNLYGDWAVWSSGAVTVGDLLAIDNGADIEIDSEGLYFGFDKQLSHALGYYGYAVGVGREDDKIGSSGSKLESKNYSLSSYMSMSINDVYSIDTSAGLGQLNIATTRIDGTQSLLGKRHAQQIFMGASLYRENVSHEYLNLRPYIATEAIYSRLPSFTEFGGDLALYFQQQSVLDTKTSFGLDVSGEIARYAGHVWPYARFEYGIEKTNNSIAKMRYADESIDYSWSAQDKVEYTSVDVGMDVALKNGVVASVSGQRRWSSNSATFHTYGLTISAQF